MRTGWRSPSGSSKSTKASVGGIDFRPVRRMPDAAHPCKGKSVEPYLKLTRRATRPYHGRRWCDWASPLIQEATDMRSKITLAAALLGVALLAGACASSEQWAEWRGHTTHFASGEHGMFSMRNNMEGTNPKVTRLDIEASRTQNWWGKQISVEPGQIIQN